MTHTTSRPRSLPHGFRPDGAGGQWHIWAPRCSRVDLVLLDGADRRVVPMRARPGGHFDGALKQVQTGQRYLFRLDGDRERPDPASRWQPEGSHGPSAVWRPEEHAWTDHAWTGTPLAELVIYELHVGTFTPEGTFDAILPRLPALRALGVTAIELMPVGQFPGERGWGYDGTYWFAVQQSYGGPGALQRFVDACHAHELSVILDVVYNHFGPEGNYLGEFGPCFTTRHSTPWGDAVNFDDDGCEGLRSLVLDNVRHWLRDFHLDGLRLDAVHAIRDDSQPHLLAEIGEVAIQEQQRLGRPIHLIAESNLNDVRLLDPPDEEGYGLHAQWNDDFHHCVHALLTGEREGYYADYFDPPRQLVKALNEVFVYDGAFSPFRGRPHGRPAGDHGGDRFVVSIQTHDQVGNRARGERLGALVPPHSQRLAACLLLLAPHIPLLFMGEEYGEIQPFPYFCDFGDPELREAVRLGRREEFAEFAWGSDPPDPFDELTFQSAKLSWQWPEGTRHAGLRRLYHDLLLLRTSHPALRDFRQRSAVMMLNDNSQPLLVLRRGGSPRQVTCVFNLEPRVAKLPRDLLGLAGLLHSEDAYYRGTAEAPEAAVRQWLRPRECFVLSPVTA